MTDIKQTTVTVHQGVDYDVFHEEITSATDPKTLPYVPPRPVDVHDEMPLSKRNAIYLMSKEEADLIAEDPRVMAVMHGTPEENGMSIGRQTWYESSVKPVSKRLGPFSSSSEINWGLAAHSKQSNPFVTAGSGYTQDWTVQTTRTGRDVDIVVMDSGVDETHPEFLDLAGVNSRVKQADWYTIGNLGTAPVNHYTDDDGHGTHVAGICAGRTYGWAKEANIYSLNILGNNTGAIDPLTAFPILLAWHQSKGNDNPTIVNMSWGYYTTYSYLGVTPNPSLGQVSDTVNTFNPAVDAEIQDCIAAGIIMVSSSGNNYHAYAKSGTADFNKSVSTPYGTFYYLRGGTPNQTVNVISVGALAASVKIPVTTSTENSQIVSADTEKKDNYSCCGSRTDIYAAGSGIVSSWSSTASIVGLQNSQYTTQLLGGGGPPSGPTTYYGVRISGTSMASPQVTGVLALYLETHRTANQAAAKAWLLANSVSNRITDTGGGYTDSTALNGSTNTMLYNAYAPYAVLRNWPAQGFNTKNVAVSPV